MEKSSHNNKHKNIDTQNLATIINTITLLALRNEAMQLVPGSFVAGGYLPALFIKPLLCGINAKAAKFHLLALWLTLEERLLHRLDEMQLLTSLKVLPHFSDTWILDGPLRLIFSSFSATSMIL